MMGIAVNQHGEDDSDRAREPYVVGFRFFERAGMIGNQKQHAPEVCR
jgi:hypothetical protein